MGNQPSLSLKKRAKNPKPSAAAAALPADASDLAAAEQQANALRLSAPGITTARPELSDEKARETPREDEDQNVSNQEADDEEDEEEDPLQFFRRLSSLSEGGGERGSQDLFMSYTQALLLKQGGDYAAAR